MTKVGVGRASRAPTELIFGRHNHGTSLRGEGLALLLCFASSRWWVWAQPQRGVSGLHRLLYRPHQIVAQGLKVGLVPELGLEGF